MYAKIKYTQHIYFSPDPAHLKLVRRSHADKRSLDDTIESENLRSLSGFVVLPIMWAAQI